MPLTERKAAFEALEQWIRRGLRCLLWCQCKHGGHAGRPLRPQRAWAEVERGRGPPACGCGGPPAAGLMGHRFGMRNPLTRGPFIA